MSESTGRATSEDDALRLFLRGRDVRCPHCGYNLRGVATERCPECGAPLVLGLRSGEDDRLPWFAGVIGAAGTMALSVVLWITRYLDVWREIPTMRVMGTNTTRDERGVAVTFFVGVAAWFWLGVLLIGRRTYARQRPAVRQTLAALAYFAFPAALVGGLAWAIG